VALYPLNIKLVCMTEDKGIDMVIGSMSIFLEAYIDVVFRIWKIRHASSGCTFEKNRKDIRGNSIVFGIIDRKLMV